MTLSLQSNLEILLKRYPFFSQRLSSRDFSSLDKRFSWQELPTGIQLFEGENKIDSSSLDFVSQFKVQDSSILFLEGFGLGVNLQKVLSHDFKEIVVVEPSWDRFLYSIGMTHLEPILENPRIHWLIGMPAAEVFAHLFTIFRKPPRSLYMDDFCFVSHPIISGAYTGYFEKVRDEWDACRAQIRRNYGGFEDSVIGLKNVLQNQKFIETTSGISSLKSQFKGVPAIVVSAGPSLKKSLPKIKAISHKALIIANDATCGILLEAGVEPHFVCSIERTEDSKKFFEGLPQNLRSRLVVYPLVPASVIDAFPGEKLCAYRDYSYFKVMEADCPKGILPSSSSVAHMCMRLADFLGCDQIALLGQDLSYDPESFQSHVDGFAFNDRTEKRSLEDLKAALVSEGEGEVLWLKGNLNPQVPTSSTYFSFLKEFSWEVTQLHAKVVNSTEGGAEIPGLEWSAIDELSAGWSEQPDLFQKIRAHTVEPIGALNFQAIKDELAAFIPRLQSLAEQAGSFSQLSKSNPGIYGQITQMIAKARADVASDSRFLGFVIEPNARNFLELENKLNSLSDSDPHLKLKCLETWFSEMKSAAQQVVKLLSFS